MEVFVQLYTKLFIDILLMLKLNTGLTNKIIQKYSH